MQEGSCLIWSACKQLRKLASKCANTFVHGRVDARVSVCAAPRTSQQRSGTRGRAGAQADFWFADAEPRQPAFRVLRLLPLDAATSAARSAPEEGAPLLPLAVQRSGGSHGGPNAGLEGAPKLKLRTGLDGRGSVRAAGCDRSAGDVWCADGQLDSRLSRSFTEYLSTYAEFLEAPWAK